MEKRLPMITADEEEALMFVASKIYGADFMRENAEDLMFACYEQDGTVYRLLWLLGDTREESKTLAIIKQGMTVEWIKKDVERLSLEREGL